MLECNIFPWMGSRPIAEIQPKDILACLRRVEERGTIETAHRTLQICGQVFRYAVSTGRVERDITQDLKGALPPAKGEHFAAITEPKQAAELLRAIDSYQGSLPALCVLKLAPLVFVRPGELRAMQWQDVDLETAEWLYLVSKTKYSHCPAVATSDRHIERTTSANRPRPLCFPVGAHAVRDPNGRAYNRTAHLPERREMMQTWADYLDGLKAGTQVIPFAKAR